jgi:hypothetical protein
MVEKYMIMSNKKIYVIWNCDWYKDNLLNEIKISPQDHLFVLLPQEYSIGRFLHEDYLELDRELKKGNKRLTIYLGRENVADLNKGYERIEWKHWDSIEWFIKSFDFFSPDRSLNGLDQIKYFEHLRETIKPSKHFTSMVLLKIGREWRNYIVNQIYKFGIQNHGNFAFRVDEALVDYIKKYQNNDLWMTRFPQKNSGNYLFKIDYFDMIDKKIEREDSPLENKCSGIVQTCVPPEFLECSFYIGIETLYDDFFVTEKTTRAIICKKPFVIFSCVNFHKKLEEKYGFKLHSQIIDYSFDSIEDSIERFDKQIDELNKLKSKYTPQEIYEITREDVEHNFGVAQKIKNTRIGLEIPDEFYYSIKERYFKKFYE